MIFRSQQFALLDNCCREFLFLQDFFIVTGQHAQDLFNAVLGKTLAMFLVRVTSQLHTTVIAARVVLRVALRKAQEAVAFHVQAQKHH